MVHWTGQTNKWQTNDRGHSGSGEASGGAILLLPWGCSSSGCRCKLTTIITRCCVAWGKFIELLPILTSRSFPITPRERVNNSCVRSVMLHSSETWAPTLFYLHCLQLNDRAMIRWMCGVTTKDQVSSWRRCSLTIWQRYSTPTDLYGMAV